VVNETLAVTDPALVRSEVVTVQGHRINFCGHSRCTPVNLQVTSSPVDLACQQSPGAQPPVRPLHGLEAHRTAEVVAPPAPHCVYALMPMIQAATC